MGLERPAGDSPERSLPTWLALRPAGCCGSRGDLGTRPAGKAGGSAGTTARRRRRAGTAESARSTRPPPPRAEGGPRAGAGPWRRRRGVRGRARGAGTRQLTAGVVSPPGRGPGGGVSGAGPQGRVALRRSWPWVAGAESERSAQRRLGVGGKPGQGGYGSEPRPPGGRSGVWARRGRGKLGGEGSARWRRGGGRV